MYLTRLIQKTIEKKLKSSGAIEIKGPKFCGKTTTSKRFCNSKIQLITDDVIEIVSIDPKAALVGEYPRLIDECLNVPEIWNCLREKVLLWEFQRVPLPIPRVQVMCLFFLIQFVQGMEL